ncbi:MAG: hypothetical protein KKA07_06600 [Bacteroidetes bacterium]|nr:hypothetical protein [Bacteroidota bacterium]
MKNIIIVVALLVLPGFSIMAQDVSGAIDERNQLINDYERIRHTFIEDTISEKTQGRIDRLENIIEKDNYVIDVFQGNYAVSKEDSLTMARMQEEIDKQSEKAQMVDDYKIYVIAGGGAVAFLMLLFLILWISGKSKSRKYKKNYEIEKQLAAKHGAEKEKLNAEIKHLNDNSRSEYSNLKELSEMEIEKIKKHEADLEQQVEELRIEIENTLADLKAALEAKSNVEAELRQLIGKIKE